jgi:hypothetical protein
VREVPSPMRIIRIIVKFKVYKRFLPSHSSFRSIVLLFSTSLNIDRNKDIASKQVSSFCKTIFKSNEYIISARGR